MDYQFQYVELEARHKAGLKRYKEQSRERKQLMMNPVMNNSRIIQLDGEMLVQEDLNRDCKEQLDVISKTLASITKNLNNLELQVFYYRYVKNYKLKTISKKLHYSHSHIRRVAAKIKRKVDVYKDER